MNIWNDWLKKQMAGRSDATRFGHVPMTRLWSPLADHNLSERIKDYVLSGRQVSIRVLNDWMLQAEELERNQK